MSTDLVPMESANGRWSRGQTYAPIEGNHKGHVVEIINPAAQIKVPVPTRVRGKVVIELHEGLVVYVRCQTCLMSWTFDESNVVVT